MFIEDGGGVAFIQPYKKGLSAITLAMTDPSGEVLVEQMGPEGAGTWFQMVEGDDEIKLNSGNTVRAIYAPVKLRVTATSTGVRMYNHGKV